MPRCKDGVWREWESYEGRQYTGTSSNQDDKKAQSEAMRRLAAKIVAAESGSQVLDKNITVKKWSETWLTTYIRPRVREPGQPKIKGTMTQKSYEMYEDKLALILPTVGHLKMKEVRDTHLLKILNGQAGKSKSHVGKICNVIQALFRQAYASHIISYDPSVGLKLPAVTDGKRRSLTAKERELLHEAAGIHRAGLWIETLLGTGIRPGESAPLQVKDFDFTTGLLSITKDVESGTKMTSDPKTKAGIRKIPIPDELAPKLQAAFSGRSPFDLAFPQVNGKMKTGRSIANDWLSFRRLMDILGGAETVMMRKLNGKVYRKTLKAARDGYEKAALGKDSKSILSKDLVLYCLRHTYCTDLKKKGVPVDIAMYLMGHADIRMTANIYAHDDDETAIIAAAYINPKKEITTNATTNKTMKTGTD
jgi:integrase